MDILYCNIGSHPFYNGERDIPIEGGGSYEDKYEINNFTDHGGEFFGHVEAPGESRTIDVEYFSKVAEEGTRQVHAEDVLVVWCAAGKLVGWYKHADVYRYQQNTSAEIAAERVHSEYCIHSREAVRIPNGQRKEITSQRWRNIWHGDDETNRKVLEFISSYEKYTSFINSRDEEDISEMPEEKLVGYDVDVLSKTRVNQEAFRLQLLKEYKGECSIKPCGICFEKALIASHIRPWRDSNCNDKLSKCNGLLLCPNHDKLFDKGFISFDENGKVMISDELAANHPERFNIMPYSKIELRPEMQPFMKYHRTKIFIGSK